MAKGRKRFRRGSRKGRSRQSSRFAAKVVDAIVTPQTYAQEIATTVALNQGSATLGSGVTYRTSDIDIAAGGSTITNGNSLFGVNHLLRIANIVSGAPGDLSDKFYVMHGILTYNVTNMNNFRVFGTAWYCKVRRDLGNTGAQDDAVHMLNDGFIKNGYSTDAAATGLRQAELTPYQSSTYCTFFKILRGRRFNLKAGCNRIFSLKSNKRWRCNPAMFVIPHDQTTTWLTATKALAWHKGDRFILFQFNPQTAMNNGSFAVVTPTGLMTIRTINRIGYKIVSVNATHLTIQPPLGFSDITTPEIMTEFTVLPSLTTNAG